MTDRKSNRTTPAETDQKANPPAGSSALKPKSLPYDAVEKVCNQGFVLTAAISSVCNDLAGEYAGLEYAHLFHQLILLRTTAERLEGMFDHLVGGDICGGLAESMGLPDMIGGSHV